jgi:hypothetical protein
MYQYIVLIFLLNPDGSAKMVRDIEVQERSICVEMVIKINDDKETPFNAACYGRTLKRI